MERVAGPLVVDLCWLLPTGIVDRRYAPTIGDVETGRVATLTIRVESHAPPATPRQPYKVLCSDATGDLNLVFFHAQAEYLRRVLPPGEVRVISGMVDRYQGVAQITHPDHIVPLAERAGVMTIEPVYPMTAGLGPRVLLRAVRAALGRAPELPEWLDRHLVERQGWPVWRQALDAVHVPTAEPDLAAPARQRLAFDELLANQLALALHRRRQRRQPGRRLAVESDLARRAEAALPFRLTGSQSRALADIRADLQSGSRMLRLMQGDVGSGKTVVALLAMLDVVANGGQAVLMAPTELLARQHLATIGPFATAVGVRTALLTGRERGRPRAEVVAGLADGTLPIAVGTHALFQDDVAYADLAFTVVDEQHRFGVEQRMRLAQKGRAPHVLVMTATPIPRTLMLTAYGDLDSSLLTEKPPGRQSIDTRVLPAERLPEVVAAVGRALGQGRKVYWVCPLVEESELLDLAAAEERHTFLRERFGEQVGLVHGRMNGRDKDRTMAAFAEGNVNLLVATTVIEVGVDVAKATIMVIEHAERFGLAQLHQLRGRVGRGRDASACLLLYSPPLGETAKARLAILRETDDGFRIAEEDLRLRGAGEVLGTRQSGLPNFRLADLAAHGDLLISARAEAARILELDPELAGDRAAALRILLYLFERDAGVRYARSG